MRINFKIDLQKKHSDLLTMMSKKSLDDMNQFLSSLYHELLYNLDFSQLDKETILNLLTLLNKSPSF